MLRHYDNGSFNLVAQSSGSADKDQFVVESRHQWTLGYFSRLRDDQSDSTPWRRWGSDPYKNAREAHKKTILNRYDLQASNIPSTTDRELPNEQVSIHASSSVGRKRSRSPTMTDPTPQKKIKEAVSSDDLSSCGASGVQTSGPVRRTSTQPNESCDDLPKDPNANPGHGRCTRTMGLQPWVDCGASELLFPFRDLPLPPFSTTDGSSEANTHGAQHPSWVLSPEGTTTLPSPPLDCVHACKSLPKSPAMLPVSRVRNAGLSGHDVYGQDNDHLIIANGDSNDACQVPRDPSFPCIGDGGDDDVYRKDDDDLSLVDGDTHDTSQVRRDLPDPCTTDDGHGIDLPAVLPVSQLRSAGPNGNDIYGQEDDHSDIENGNGRDTTQVPRDPSVPCIDNDGGDYVYGQYDDDLDIVNGDIHDTNQVHREFPDSCIADDGHGIDLPAVLPVSQLRSAGPNGDDIYRQDDDTENGDGRDTTQVPHDLSVPYIGNDGGDDVYGQYGNDLNIMNGDTHDTSQVRLDSPDPCAGNDGHDIDLPTVLGDVVYRQDDDINLPAVPPASQIRSAELDGSGIYGQDDDHLNIENGDCHDTSPVRRDCNDGDDMVVEGGDEGGAEDTSDDTSGNNKNDGHVDNAGIDIDASDDDRESIRIMETDGEYIDEDYHADCDGEGEACHDGRDVLWTHPDALQGKQAGRRPLNHGSTIHGGKQKNCSGDCRGGSSGWQTQSGVDKDIALGQLLNVQNQSATKGDVVILASAILDLKDAITQCGAGDPILTTSKPLPATQPTSTVGGSDDPMPDYGRKRRDKPKLGLQESVQQHAVYLLKRKNRRQPFPKVASPNETALYAVTGQGGPTAENFRLDFHGPLASAWNKRAAEVFASHFFDCGWYGSPKKDDIKRVFETHMHTLRAQHARLNADTPPDDEQTQIKRDEEKEKARAQRR
ncbi:hypothetical protein EDC04DRAFT_2900483 [Pisolithus marmoratus]|nr:hypothetical protein EDC04DRAFT_2900483 [Pisolithus marmoratus]